MTPPTTRPSPPSPSRTTPARRNTTTSAWRTTTPRTATSTPPLSEIALAKADTLAAKNYLATGLTAYPDNASILTSLINLYLTTNEDPAKIVELLDEAKKAMPDNPSLYYVEGNIYAGIKKFDEADAAYNKALEINPTYDMAYYGLASVLLKRGEELVDEMNALDVREYRVSSCRCSPPSRAATTSPSASTGATV